MTDFVFTSSGGRLADGITLGAYPAENWVEPGQPSGAPVGSATDTATFTDGTCTFEGLSPGGKYWVVKTSSPYVYTFIQVSEPEYVDPAGIEPGEPGQELVTTDGEVGWQNPARKLWAPNGGIDTIADRSSTLINSVLTGGRLRITALSEPLLAGETYSNIDVHSGTGASSGLTHSWACLFDFDTMTILRSSADITSEWTASTLRTFVLNGAYTPDETIAHPGVGVLCTATTTVASTLAVNTAMGVAGYAQSPRITAAQDSFTTPAADDTVVTPIPSAAIVWATVY